MEKKITFALLIIIIIVISVFLARKSLIKQPAVNQSPEANTIQANGGPLTYDQEKTKRKNELLKNRAPLSTSDQISKEEEIKTPNPLKTTDMYKIEYLPSLDEFQVELTTIRINTAKADAVAWFKSQGFSDEAICKLPVVFTIDNRDAESLRGMNIIFNPLAPGC